MHNEKILYINCCPRKNSRTDYLARILLKKLGGEVEELNLYNEDLKPLNASSLNERTKLLEHGELSSPMFAYAKQFANADTIVISAPYWDLSFPAMLKIYLENIYVTGIVSCYTAEGIPKGLCKGKALYYVVTAGGPYIPDYSFGYIKRMATEFFDIDKAVLIKAEMLDVEGFSSEKILAEAVKEINNLSL